MGEAARKRITVDEFLSWDGEGDRRYELIDGEIVAMAPPANAHAIIVPNVIGAIRPRLRPPCRILSEVGIVLSFRDDSFYQADIAVTCAPVDTRAHGISEPIVLFEVLSPSTAARDRGIKLSDYRLIGSVQDIVVIASDRLLVEHWRRDSHAWTVTDLATGDQLRLSSIGFDIPIEAIYEGLDLSAGAS